MARMHSALSEFVKLNKARFMLSATLRMRSDNEIKELKRLVFRILDLLAMIETPNNQPIVNRIKGLIYEILDTIEKYD